MAQDAPDIRKKQWSFTVNFGMSGFLSEWVKHHQRKLEEEIGDIEENPLPWAVMFAGAWTDWFAKLLTDPNIEWQEETFSIDELTLTGTNPIWNPVVIDRCGGSPAKLRKLLKDEPETAKLFSAVRFHDFPIVVELVGDSLEIRDGSKRVFAAIRDGEPSEITAILFRHNDEPSAQIEAHVVEELLWLVNKEIVVDPDELSEVVGALRVLQRYSNVRDLLQTRFGPEWVLHQRTRDVVERALEG